MAAIAEKFVLGIGLNNAFFNIEFIYNPDINQIHIVEVNPRMCSQFADLYEKVDANNTYQALVDIALGNKPTLSHNQGVFACAASFVLRRFDNKRVTKIPTAQELQRFYQEFPEARVETHVIAGQYLNAIMQDGKSYRYGLIHLGAKDRDELYAKFERSKQLLSFEFAD